MDCEIAGEQDILATQTFSGSVSARFEPLTTPGPQEPDGGAMALPTPGAQSVLGVPVAGEVRARRLGLAAVTASLLRFPVDERVPVPCCQDPFLFPKSL